MDPQRKTTQYKRPIGLFILISIVMLIFAGLAAFSIYRIFFHR